MKRTYCIFPINTPGFVGLLRPGSLMVLSATLMVVASSPVVSADSSTQVVCSIPLSEGRGGTVAVHGAKSHAIQLRGIKWGRGPYGRNALLFAGQTSRLELPAIPEDLGETGVTVEVWLQLDRGTSGPLLSLGVAGASCQSLLERNGITLRTGRKELHAPSSALFDGRWHLVDFSLSPTDGMAVFVDGLPVAETREGPPVAALRRPGLTLGGGFHGSLGPVTVLRGCLNAPQLLARYATDAAVAHWTDTPPVVDGKLDDACWQTGAVLSGFSVAGQATALAPAEEQTEALLAYDAASLYLGATLHCPDVSGLVARITARDDDAIYDDDVLELFLDPKLTRKSGFHVAVNARGRVWDSDSQGTGWNGAQAKAATGEKAWSVEVVIPLRSLGAAKVDPGDAWGLNVAREQKRPVRNTSWSLLGTPSFLTWDQFGELRFGGRAAVRVLFPERLTAASQNPFPVVLRGGPRDGQVVLQVEKYPMPTGNETTEKPLSVAAGETTRVSLDPSLTGKAPEAAPVRTRQIVRVLDAASGALLAQTVAVAGGFDAGATIRDGPTSIRERYRKEHPELCTTSQRLIYNGTLYVSPDHVTPRAVAFFHTDRAHFTLDGPPHGMSLVYEMPSGVEVTALAPMGDLMLGPERLPEVQPVLRNGRPAKRYTFALTYIQNQPEHAGSHMAYFRSTLPAGTVTQGAYYLKWRGGRQKPQTIRIESIGIPKVRPPRRFFIMPWGLEQSHVPLLSPNFPEDYTSLGMNMISFYYLGHWRDQERLRKCLDAGEALAAKARARGVFMCYNGFFPWSPNAEYGMMSWMSDLDAWAYAADGKPAPGWLSGHVPCPSYRGRFYQEAVTTLENSEQLRRMPANFFSCDFEYYSDNGTRICFCPGCVTLFEKWFRERHPGAEYVDPFTLEKNTERPKADSGNYEVKTKYPLQYQAWVNFKVEQFAEMAAGFKRAIAKVVGNAKTSPFDQLTFADWAAVYPTVLQQEQCLYGPYSMDHSFDLYAVGAYGPPALACQPNFEQYVKLYYETFGKRRSIYDTPSTSGAWVASNYACMPEHARYYLLESAMNGVQGFILFHYSGLEGKQLQINAEVFGALALVDDLITQGRRMRDLRIQGREMHARGLQLGNERLVLVGDHYVATDQRRGVLTCPVEAKAPVYDVLKRRKLGALTPSRDKITLALEGLNDRARFLYVGNRWEQRLSSESREKE